MDQSRWNQRRRGPLKGQTMVLFALLLPVLIGMLGLGVDAGHLFNTRRDIQSAADLAALAGASQIPDDLGAASSIASDIAEANGFADGVTVTTSFGGDDTRIEVAITKQVDLFFMPVLGLSSVTVSARSVASHEINAGTAVLAKKDTHCWTRTIYWHGSNITVDGSVHSNSGLTLSGNDNTVNGSFTYKVGPPTYPLDGWQDCSPNVSMTGSNPAIELEPGPWQPYPMTFTTADFPCTYNLGTSNGDLSRDGPWWQGGYMEYNRTLNPGVICFNASQDSGLWMTLNANNIKGNVTFRARRIDIRGSNLNFTAYKDDVLFFSHGNQFYPAILLVPNGGTFEGLIYADDSQVRIDGQGGFKQVGSVIAWAVRLGGNGWYLFGTEDATYEPMRLVE